MIRFISIMSRNRVPVRFYVPGESNYSIQPMRSRPVARNFEDYEILFVHTVVVRGNLGIVRKTC